MYLSESLVTRTGTSFAMAGLLPVSTLMLPKRKALGYAEVTLSEATMLGDKGTVLRGHEFHYSEIKATDSCCDAWHQPYTVRHRSGVESCQGFLKGNVLASYVHLHFGSNPGAVAFLVEHINRSHR